jgi:hypothetical protein
MTVSRPRAAAALAALLATTAYLHELRHHLGAPPLTSWADASTWYDHLGPAAAVMACVRLAAMVASAWLALATALQLVASVADVHALRQIADLVSPRWLQRIGHGLASASLSAGLTLGTPPLVVAPVSVVQVQPADETSGEGIAVMRPLEAGAATTTTMTTTTTSPAEEIVVVTPGSSCWSLAEQALVDRLGRPPSESEVRRLWALVVAANVERFSTGDPDLIFPGQQLLIPRQA